MRRRALFNKQYEVLLISVLIFSCLLTGCASGFDRFYKPAAGSPGREVASPPANPVLLSSRDPDREGERLARKGYVLIGTSSFHNGDDPFYADDAKEAVAQGKRVGAAVVLLKVEGTYMQYHGPSGLSGTSGTGFSVGVGQGSPVLQVIIFASYWAAPAP